MILPFDRIEVQATAGRIFADGYVGAVFPEDHACIVRFRLKFAWFARRGWFASDR